MLRSSRPLVLVLAFVASLIPGIARAGVDLRENPWSPLSAGTLLDGPTSVVGRHNFAVYMKRYRSRIKNLFGDRMIALREAELSGKGVDAGFTPPIMDITPDASVDAIPRFAAVLQKPYFPNQSVSEVTQYLRDRVVDYGKAASAMGLSALSLGTACDYGAESMYLVGEHATVDPATQRASIRGTCTVMTMLLENTGHLQTNADRQELVQYFAIVGAGYRDLDRRYAESGDTAAREKIDADARTTFKQIFDVNMSETPPDKFPCMLAGDGVSCADLQKNGPAVFAALVSKYP